MARRSQFLLFVVFAALALGLDSVATTEGGSCPASQGGDSCQAEPAKQTNLPPLNKERKLKKETSTRDPTMLDEPDFVAGFSGKDLSKRLYEREVVRRRLEENEEAKGDIAYLTKIWQKYQNRCDFPKLKAPYTLADLTALDQPVILTDVVDTWPAKQLWAIENITKDARFFRGVTFQRNMASLASLFDYFANSSHMDRQPEMLFSSNFFDLFPEALEDYSIPSVFIDEDLFEHIEPRRRPLFRWMLLAPPRSGSFWHVDPLNTSAWNALVVGHKLWAVYPPDTARVAGVNSDKVEYNEPVSIFDWWRYTLSALRPEHRPRVCMQAPGETIFVPSGWWHSVLNMDITVAVTQNLCLFEHADRCISLLRKQTKLSGKLALRDLIWRFGATHPQIFQPSDYDLDTIENPEHRSLKLD